MDKRTAETAEAFCCLTCGAPLGLLPDSHPLLFLCAEGHAFTVTRLISEESLATERALEEALEGWARKASILERLAAQARSNGHALVAVSFEEDLEKVRGRIQRLRQARSSGSVGESSPLPRPTEG